MMKTHLYISCARLSAWIEAHKNNNPNTKASWSFWKQPVTSSIFERAVILTYSNYKGQHDPVMIYLWFCLWFCLKKAVVQILLHRSPFAHRAVPNGRWASSSDGSTFNMPQLKWFCSGWWFTHTIHLFFHELIRSKPSIKSLQAWHSERLKSSKRD